MKRWLRTSVIQTVASLHLDEVMLRRLRWRASRGSPLVLVVEMHETLQRDGDQFRRQLEWAAKHFTFISPETFFGLWDRTPPPPNWSKPAVLFTFDDGRESNYTVGAPMLESMGTRGLFFVVPEFVGLTAQSARDFYYSRIDIRGLARSEAGEQWTPMNPDQLADLTRRGHSIGNHTLSHVSLAGLSPSDLDRQIGTSAAKISSWITEKRGSLCLAVFVECDQPGSVGFDSENPSLLFFALSRNDQLLGGLAAPDLANRDRSLLFRFAIPVHVLRIGRPSLGRQAAASQSDPESMNVRFLFG